MSNYLPPEVVQRLLGKYKPSSIDTIARGVKRVIIGLRGPAAPFQKEVLEDYPAVAAYINGLEKTSVKPALVGNIAAVAGALDDFPPTILEQYKNFFQSAAKVQRSEYQYRVALPEQVIPNLETIRKGSERLLTEARAESNHKKWLDGVILSLYSYMPALRGQEYYATRVIEIPDSATGTDYPTILQQWAHQTDANFLDLRSWQLVISDYKTKKRYDIRILDIPVGLQKILQEWLLTYPSVYLLSSREGKPLDHSSLAKHLHRLLGPEVSVDMLRKIYIAEMLHFLETIKLPGAKVAALRKNIAFHMGHSLEAQEFVYSGLRLTGNFQYSSLGFMQFMLAYYSK